MFLRHGDKPPTCCLDTLRQCVNATCQTENLEGCSRNGTQEQPLVDAEKPWSLFVGDETRVNPTVTRQESAS